MKELIKRLKSAAGDKIAGMVIAYFVTPDNVTKALSYAIFKLREACKDNGVEWDESAISAVEKALNLPPYVEK